MALVGTITGMEIGERESVVIPFMITGTPPPPYRPISSEDFTETSPSAEVVASIMEIISPV
jgi:hypothetical protein